MNDDEKKTVTRRESLGLLVGGAAMMAAGDAIAGGALPASHPTREPARSQATEKMPAIFIAHGAPMLVDMPDWMDQLRAWSAALPRPKSILMVSAHWEARPLTVGATRTVPLVYDFYGFPERYYQQKYPSPGAPELADRVSVLLEGQPVAQEPTRGLDHGAYIPLIPMYPGADVPVLQISLPSEDPGELFALGRKLAPLRDEGVLIAGSGFLTHNLRQADFGPNPRTPGWAADFDAWTADALNRRDVDALLDYRRKGPGAAMALPTQEHFVPLLVALGAAADRDRVQFPITGFMGGSFTKRSVQLG